MNEEVVKKMVDQRRRLLYILVAEAQFEEMHVTMLTPECLAYFGPSSQPPTRIWT